MFIPNLRRLSRRRFLTISAAATATAMVGRNSANAADDVMLPVPYFAQGGTGDQSSVNCGPASVAAAVNFSAVSFPTVQNVRDTLGFKGATSLDQWAWLLDAYGVPWYPTFSQPDMENALNTGHAIVIAAWMADLSAAPDLEEPYSAFWGQSGRYSSFTAGHAMVITGIADAGQNYLVHDPNVFPSQGTSYYGDGAPKGSYRRYAAWEVANTVNTYADGLALAVASILTPAPQPAAVKRIEIDKSSLFMGPGGGHAPERGERGVTGEITPDSERGVISSAEEDGEED